GRPRALGAPHLLRREDRRLRDRERGGRGVRLSERRAERLELVCWKRRRRARIVAAPRGLRLELPRRESVDLGEPPRGEPHPLPSLDRRTHLDDRAVPTSRPRPLRGRVGRPALLDPGRLYDRRNLPVFGAGARAWYQLYPQL